jgi:predicted AAA+ superfamily ATPase
LQKSKFQMDQLIEISNRLVSMVKEDFKRSLYYQINDDNRLTEITGARGTGKTTLLIQLAKRLESVGRKVLYISLDLPFFFNLINSQIIYYDAQLPANYNRPQ